jgi:quinol monooxygenase YgiN
MPIISKKNRFVTVINVFTVVPASQQQLIDVLTCATETFIRYAPGFISASVHRSFDGAKVAMYAQWRSIEDYRAMRDNPGAWPYVQQATALARFEPGVYEVVETYSVTDESD